MAKVTIGLTSYNRAEFLGQCIESILSQTYEDFELLIIDDASTDNSKEVIEYYASLDARVKFVIHESNWGRSGFYDLAPTLDTKYLAVAHDDDLWSKDKLEKQVAFLEENPGTGVCFTSVGYIDNYGNEINGFSGTTPFVIEDKDRFQWLRYFFQYGNAFCHPSVLMRREVCLNCDMRTYGLSSLPDMLIWIRVLLKYEVKVLDERLSFFRIHDDGTNVSALHPGKLNKVYTEMFFVYEAYRELRDKDDMLRVFPEAKKYLDERSLFCSDFVLAMMALDLKPNDPCKLFGLKLIFSLMQDDSQREILGRYYGFGTKQFNRLKIDNAIFSIPQVGCAKLYYDVEAKGFSEENVEEFYFPLTFDPENMVVAKFNTDPIRGAFGKIRFDPVDNMSVSCRLVSVKIDGIDLKLNARNAFVTLDDKTDVFLTLDPRYEAEEEIRFGEHIEITFIVEQIDQDKVIKRIHKLSKHSIFDRLKKG